MRSDEFFATHPVFTLREFLDTRTAVNRNVSTAKNLLAKHVASGRLLRVRRGLYATVPRGVAAAQAPVDPYLLASRLTDDAVVAYHAALQFHGKSYSVWRRFHYLTAERRRPFTFRGDEFISVQIPASLQPLADRGGGMEDASHAGATLKVTTLERTMVDVLGSPQRAGGWEEVWRSLEMVEFFDIDAVVTYVIRLGSALTLARVGFFLEEHRGELMVDDGTLAELRRYAPRQPRYLDAARKPGRLVRNWNLIVPDEVATRRWEEGA
ncbi:MAG: type IV toxin-antitoxin system AbiEi family antitoxin domain-containing protein [Thermoleophilia bacterium]